MLERSFLPRRERMAEVRRDAELLVARVLHAVVERERERTANGCHLFESIHGQPYSGDATGKEVSRLAVQERGERLAAPLGDS